MIQQRITIKISRVTLGYSRRSISFWAYYDDREVKKRNGIEHVLNPEECGVYLTGFFEKFIPNVIKLKMQMDFVYFQ